MMTRTVRSLALAAFLSTGLIGWSGCSEETKEKLKDAEQSVVKDAKKDAKAVGDKIKEESKVVGDKIKEESKAISDKVKGETTPAPTPPPTPETPK